MPRDRKINRLRDRCLTFCTRRIKRKRWERNKKRQWSSRWLRQVCMHRRPISREWRNKRGCRRKWKESDSVMTYCEHRKKERWNPCRRSKQNKLCRVSINKICRIRRLSRGIREIDWSRRITCMQVFRMNICDTQKKGVSNSSIISRSTKKITIWKLRPCQAS